ncbi:MAG: VanZ family protein [Desulfuromonadales bacterium]
MTAGNKLKTQTPDIIEFILRLCLPLAWSIIIIWLSLTSAPPQISGVLGWDKLLHAGAYGLLSLLIAQFLFCLPLNPHKIWWVTWLLAICFGALMEVLQLLAHTGRTAEWRDLFADAAGAFIICVILRQFPGLVCPRYKPLEKDHG